MIRSVTFAALILSSVFAVNSVVRADGSFICQEPGGKRLVYIRDKEVSLTPGSKMLIYISGNDLLVGDIHAEPTLVVDEHDIRPSAAGVKIATFDGDNIRHGPHADGKVLFYYKHPSISPSFNENRIYSIEGDPLSKQQLVAGLYVLRPELFKLSDAEVAEQVKAMKEAAAADAAAAAADQVAGKWMVLNSTGPVEKTGKGFITFAPKKSGAYPVTYDLSRGDGPTWTGVAFYKEIIGDKLIWAAYGTPKTVGLCVYEIDGGSLKGTWYPWYIDGDPKNIGTEVLKGPETLDGDYTIESAKAPFSGASYTGTVSIKPLEIVGSNDDAKPYALTWTIGTAKVSGIGILHKKMLFVASGTGADVNIAAYQINNGSFQGDWYKLGSTEKGSAAATTAN